MTRYGDPGPSFDEFSRTMVWPRLLRSAGLALRPARLGLCLVLMLLVGLVGRLPSVWLAKNTGPFPVMTDAAQAGMVGVRRSVMDLDPVGLTKALGRIFVEGPLEALREFPWWSLAIAAPALVLAGILGGAAARLAAEEHATGRRSSWVAGVGFALSRWVSLTACVLAPLFLFVLACALLASAGWVLLHFTVLQPVGGALYGLGLAAGFVVTILGFAAVLGLPMLIPAVAVEGTDAIDSIQRTLAYALARPGRLALYVAVLVAQLVVAFLALTVVVQAAEALTAWCVTAFLPGDQAGAFRDAAAGTLADRGGTAPFVRRAIAFWHLLPELLIGAYVLSFFFSGGSVLYLCMRRVCDGQDPADLWRPGLTSGVAADGDEGDDGSDGE